MLLRNLFYLLGPRLRRVVRRIWFLPADVYASVFCKREALVPPKGMIFTGAGNFSSIGDKLLQNFIALCDLAPDNSVLDIGCGIGRVAKPLTTYLNKEGAYIGFDVVPLGVKWCQHHYTAFPTFRFQYIPLKNDLYNLSTKADPATFTFPYQNECFDLVVSISVFTHMQEAGVRRYMSEICRVLKPGGYCFCTFFLITPESDRYLKESKNPFFNYRYANFFLHDARVKDANIAYRYQVIEEMITASNLTIKSFHSGWWAGKAKENTIDYQDILIIQK